MSILMKILIAIGAFTLFIGGGGFILGFIGVIGVAGVGLFVAMLPIIGIIFVLMFIVWLIYKFGCTLFKDKKEKGS